MMFYKSFSRDPLGGHQKKVLHGGAPRYLLLFACLFVCGSTIAQCTIPGDVIASYVSDTRTYGIRYKRAWFDSVLHFPIICDTLPADTAHAPAIFATGPGLLWWHYKNHNYPIGSGSGSVTGATNGLDLFGSNIGEGYAGAAPNLVKAVFTKPGLHTYCVGCDSTYFTTGSTDTSTGPFMGIGQSSSFANGPTFRGGYQASGVSNFEEVDANSASWNVNLADGTSLFDGVFETGFEITLVDGATSTSFNETWDLATPSLAYQVLAPQGMYWLTNTDAVSNAWPTSMQLDSGLKMKTVPSIGGNGGCFLWADSKGTTHVNRLSVNGDDSLSLVGSITATINSGLGVTSGPSGYVINGQDQAFTITFTTGAITPGLDSTESIIRISWRGSSEGSYIVTPVAYNSTAGIALGVVQPYIVNISNQTFELHGALTNWSGLGFLPSTVYTFAFKTVDF